MASAMQNLTNAPSVMLKMKGVGSHFGADSEFMQSVHRTVSSVGTVPQMSSNVLMDTQRVSDVLNEKATQRYGMLIDRFI